MAIELERMVLLVSGVAMLAIAGAILVGGPGRGIHRAFAALVAMKGAAVLLSDVSNDPDWTWTAISVQPYFALALIPIALYCLHATPRGDEGQVKRAAGWLALGGVLVLDLAYWADHSLFHGLARDETATGALRAADGIVYTSTGPLAAVAATAGPLLALLALRLAMRYRADARSPSGMTQLLLCCGLLIGALFDSASRLSALVSLLDSSPGFPWLPWGWADAILPVLALIPALLTVGVLVAGRAVERRPQHVLEGRLLVLAAFAFFSGFMRLAAPSDSDPGGSALVLVLLGFWRLMMPVLVAFAVLRTPLPSAAPILDEPRPSPAHPGRLSLR